MHIVNVIFWMLFGAAALWVAWGFIRMFLRDDGFAAPRGTARHSAGGGSHADNSAAGLGVIGSSTTSLDLSTDTGVDYGGGGDSGGDSGGSDSGGGDSGGGGDFSGGGGDSGGGGSSGGW